MGHQSYFILTSSEDGISIETMSKEDMEKSLRKNEWGSKVKFLKQVPEIDKGCFWLENGEEDAVLIIKGEIIVPKPVKTVTEYELE